MRFARMNRRPHSLVIPLTFALAAVLWVTVAQGQSNLPPSLFNSSDRAQELIQGPSADTLDPRTDTMHVFTRVDVMPVAPLASVYNCDHVVFDTGDSMTVCADLIKLYIRFTVERNGLVSSPTILKRTVGGEGPWDKLALDCVSNMPAWKPGQLKGVPVRVQMILPVKVCEH